MELLTKAIERRLPPLYSQENEVDPMVHAKFFAPDSGWTWFVTEGSEEPNAPLVRTVKKFRRDVMFFGFVIGNEKEWDYFMLSELTAYRSSWFGLGVECDMYFKPGRFSEVMQRCNGTTPNAAEGGSDDLSTERTLRSRR